MNRLLISIVVLGCALGAGPATLPVKESIDASALPVEQKFPKQEAVRAWRPMERKDHKGTLVVENLRISNALNQRGIDVALTSMDRETPSPGEALTFAKVIIRNVETSEIRRDELGRQMGLHLDHIRLTGGGDFQPFAAEVVLEDVYIHGGEAVPLLIQDGKYSRITLRRVKIENEHGGGAQIAAIAAGSVGDVIIEDSPGLKVALIGRAGSIKRCIVKNSPGAVVNDAATAIGKSGAEIVDGDDVVVELDEVKEVKTGAGLRETKAVATRPSAKPGVKLAAPKLVLVEDRANKKIVASLEGELGEDVAYVTFEAFDWNDYRLAAPIVVMESPWKAALGVGKKGVITVRAVVTKLGGDGEKEIVGKIEVE